MRSFTAEPLGANQWRVRLVLENTGWMPTNGSQEAVDQQVVRGVSAELTMPDNVRLVEGQARQTLGQLDGRSSQRSTATWWGYSAGTPDRAFADWIVNAPAGTRVSVNATSERAGSARAEVTLENAR